jgi:putative membrane protein
LTLPLPLLLLGRHLTAPKLYTIELAVLALGLALVLLPASRERLTSATSRQTRVRRVARDHFFERGLHRTATRTGVLLYVAPAERCAEIIADAGAAGPLPEEACRPCLDESLTEARRDRLADGIAGAVTRLGAALRDHAPAGPGARNEAPDRVVLL